MSKFNKDKSIIYSCLLIIDSYSTETRSRQTPSVLGGLTPTAAKTATSGIAWNSKTNQKQHPKYKQQRLIRSHQYSNETDMRRLY